MTGILSATVSEAEELTQYVNATFLEYSGRYAYPEETNNCKVPSAKDIHAIRINLIAFLPEYPTIFKNQSATLAFDVIALRCEASEELNKSGPNPFSTAVQRYAEAILFGKEAAHLAVAQVEFTAQASFYFAMDKLESFANLRETRKKA